MFCSSQSCSFSSGIIRKLLFSIVVCWGMTACINSNGNNLFPRYWELKKKSGKVVLESVELIPLGQGKYKLKQWFRGPIWFAGEYRLDGNRLISTKLRLGRSPFYKGFTASWIILKDKSMKSDNKRQTGDKRNKFDNFYLVAKKFSPSDLKFAEKLTGPWKVAWINRGGKKIQFKLTISKESPYKCFGKEYQRFSLKPTVFGGSYILSGKKLVRVSGAVNKQSGCGWDYAGSGKFEVSGKTIYDATMTSLDAAKRKAFAKSPPPVSASQSNEKEPEPGKVFDWTLYNGKKFKAIFKGFDKQGRGIFKAAKSKSVVYYYPLRALSKKDRKRVYKLGKK